MLSGIWVADERNIQFVRSLAQKALNTNVCFSALNWPNCELLTLTEFFKKSVFISLSSSWCHAVSTDIPDPLSPLLPIIYRLWQLYIQYLHIAAVCMFELVVLLFLGHMWGSIGVHHLCARLCFSSRVLNVWLV